MEINTETNGKLYVGEWKPKHASKLATRGRTTSYNSLSWNIKTHKKFAGKIWPQAHIKT